MKMIYCTYNVSVAEEMLKILEEEAIKHFQIFENVLAKTEGSDPRYNTAVWPGFNNSLMVQADDDEFERLSKKISEYNNITEDKNEQISINSWNIN